MRASLSHRKRGSHARYSSDLMANERARDIRAGAAATAVYAATAVLYFVTPLGTRFGEGLLGTALFAHDSIFNAGILEWGYRSLWSPARRVFEWTAGFPLHDSLATTENLIGWQLFYTPLRFLGLGTVASYNSLIVISFILSGLGAFLFSRRLGADRSGAAVAGFVFAFVPFHLNHVIAIQTLSVCYCPFALYFLDRFLSKASLGNACGLAASFLMTALSGIYFGVFLTGVLTLYSLLGLVSGRHSFRFGVLAGIAGAAVACAGALVPIVLPYLRFGSEYGYRHPEDTVVRFSLEALAVVKVPQWLAFWSHGPFPRRDTWTPAFPGLAAGLLALAGLAGKGEEEDRPSRIVLVMLLLFCFVLSLGPVLKIHADAPTGIPLPGKVFTFFSAIRWPMRILLFAFLFGAVLAGLGFARLTRRWAPGVRSAATALTILALFVEYRPQRSYAAGSLELPPPLEISDAYPFLAGEADRGGVVEVPSARPDGYAAPYLMLYVYGSAGHLRRVVAIHGAVTPRIVDNLTAAAERLPDEPSRRFLAAWGVTRLVTHREPRFTDSRPGRREALVAAGYPVLFETKGTTVFDLKTTPWLIGGRQDSPATKKAP